MNPTTMKDRHSHESRGARAGSTHSLRRAPKAKAPKPPQHQPKPATACCASPLARRIAASKGINIAALSGTGPRGRIVKSDVENAKPGAARPAPAAAAGAAPSGGGIGVAALPMSRMFYKAGEYEEVPHDSMRKAIAKRLTSAKALIPHYYLTVDCNLTALMATREALNKAAGENAAYKLSVNDFVVKASAMALMKHPYINASWTDTAILKHKHADVGIAVAIPSA